MEEHRTTADGLTFSPDIDWYRTFHRQGRLLMECIVGDTPKRPCLRIQLFAHIHENGSEYPFFHAQGLGGWMDEFEVEQEGDDWQGAIGIAERFVRIAPALIDAMKPDDWEETSHG